MRIGVIADDLTGAFDTGVQFRNWGFKVEVMVGNSMPWEVDEDSEVVILDTESRHDKREMAYAKVKKAVELIKSLEIEYFYKKIDSTLRGNIGVELDAVLDATNSNVAFVAPAYPAYGRTTVKGKHLINELPLDETEYIHEIDIKDSYIANIIKHQCKRQIGSIELKHVKKGRKALREQIELLLSHGYEVIVFDAQSEKDLLEIMRCAEDVKIFVGSAGLASELPHGLNIREVKPVLSLIGSTRNLTRNQALMLKKRLGCIEIKFDSLRCIEGGDSYNDELNRCVSEALKALKCGDDVMIGSAFGDNVYEKTLSYGRILGLDGAEVKSKIEDALGIIAISIINKIKVSGLILTGGATAMKVFEALEVDRASILKEVQPGMPLLELPNGLRTITKAGGFGKEDSLIQAVKNLRRAPWV